MNEPTKTCFKCNGENGDDTEVLYGYTICSTCKSNLGLFLDETIKRHIAKREIKRQKDPGLMSYEEDIRYRLDFIEKDYISKKIKLLHCLERLEYI